MSHLEDVGCAVFVAAATAVPVMVIAVAVILVKIAWSM